MSNYSSVHSDGDHLLNASLILRTFITPCLLPRGVTCSPGCMREVGLCKKSFGLGKIWSVTSLVVGCKDSLKSIVQNAQSKERVLRVEMVT